MKTADEIWPPAQREAYYKHRNAGLRWLVVVVGVPLLLTVLGVLLGVLL